MSGTSPVPEKIVIRNSQGEVTEEATMLNGLLEGETVLYQADRVVGRLYFKEGKQEGEAVYFDPAGQVSVKSPYKNGLRHGEATYFDHNGKVARKANYASGELEGRTTDFYPTGKAREVSHYKRGVLDGELIRFNSEGKVQERLCYRSGKQVKCPQDIATLLKPALKGK